MSHDRLEALWARLLYDGQLASDEQRELVAGLEADSALREKLIDDALVDGWLSGLGSRDEAFVERIRECVAAERDGERFLRKVESRIPRRSPGRPYFLIGALAAGLLLAAGLFLMPGPEPVRPQLRRERLVAIEKESERLVQVEKEAVARKEDGAAGKARRAKEALQAEREAIEREMREAVEKARQNQPPPAVKPPEAVPVPQPPLPGPSEEKRTVAAVARLERVDGDVFIQGKAAKEGDDLLPGQMIETVGAGKAVLVFGDKTRIELGPGTRIREVTSEGGKRVGVVAGGIRAEVAKQPKGQPMVFATADAEAIVIGTTLRVLVGSGTRLDVEEGKVQLKRLSDAKTVEVLSGQFAVAAVGVDFVVKALPRVLQVARKAEDTLLYGFAGFENANFGARDRLRISAGGQGNVALIRFPGLVGPGSVPPRSTIESATLRFKSLSTGPGIGLRLRFHRCLKAWVEGRGRGEADAAQRGEACWSAAQKGILSWELPGGRGATDRSPDLGIAASKVDASGFVTFDLTAAVQAWANGEVNHGLIVDAASGDVPGELSLSSSEDAVAGNRPLLTVTFTAPAGHR